jgi:NCS2 family nucleobase:cation symporter-2
VTGGISALVLNIVLPGGGVGSGPTDYSAGLAPETATDLDEDLPDPSAPSPPGEDD